MTTIAPPIATNLQPKPLSPAGRLRRSFSQMGLMLQWQTRRTSEALPLLVLVQMLLAVATVVGFGFFVGDLDPATGLWLATGAPTITLVTVGFVMTPQTVVQAKLEGSADWLYSLPVARWVFLVADLTMWALIAIPGLFLAVIAGVIRFDLTLSIAPWLPLAIVLISLTAASVGYAIGMLFMPQVAQLVSQFLVFVILIFSPVAFPPERMPQWMQTAHEYLPFEPMADLMRAGLAQGNFTVQPRSVAVLCTWYLISLAGVVFTMQKRR